MLFSTSKQKMSRTFIGRMSDTHSFSSYYRPHFVKNQVRQVFYTVSKLDFVMPSLAGPYSIH